MKLKALKLHKISQNELTKRQMKQIAGGQNCGCGCNGPSGTWCNANANWEGQHPYSYGGAKWCASWSGGGWHQDAF